MIIAIEEEPVAFLLKNRRHSDALPEVCQGVEEHRTFHPRETASGAVSSHCNPAASPYGANGACVSWKRWMAT